MGGFIFFVICVVAIIIVVKILKNQAIEAAREKYHSALETLKKSPHNPDIKQNTLSLGRAYAAILREKGSSTLFDEVALMNDINAACASAGTPLATSSHTAVSEQVGVEAKLRTLSDLHAKGLVSAEEYERRRSLILDGI